MRASLLLALVSLSGCWPMWHGHDPTRTRQVAVYEILDTQRVVLGERDTHPAFEAIAYQEIAFSADGAHLAYPARERGRWRIVVDGVPGRSWLGIGEVVMSASGDHLAYAAEDEHGWHVVSDGWVGPAFDTIHAATLAYGPGERALVYAASDGDRAHIVVNGRTSGGFDGVGPIHFGDRGRRLAYVAYQDAQARVVSGGEVGPPYDDIPELVLAPRGQRVAYIGQKGSGFVLVVDGVQSPIVEELVALRVGDDGRHVACVLREGRRETVLADGVQHAWHERVDGESLRFSDDGAHLAYVASDGDGRRVFVDGEPGPAYAEIDGPRFGANGVAAYVGRGPGRSVVHVGARTIVHEGVWAGNVVLAPRGPRFAYLLRAGDRTAVVTDRGRRTFDAVVTSSLVFDASGRRWGILAIDRASQRTSVVLDNGEQRPFDVDEVTSLALSDALSTRAASDPSEAVRAWIQVALREER